VLSSPVKVREINQPVNNAERQFVLTFKQTSADSERGDDLAAKRHWEEMAQKLKSDEVEERMWNLLALARAQERDAAMRDRRHFVESQLDEARLARVGDRIGDAKAIEKKLLDEYGHFTDLADLFSNLRQASVPPEAVHGPSSGSPPQSEPGDEAKSSGAATGHESDPPNDAGSSHRRAQPPSPNDQPRPKPADDQPKSTPD
jgi:hypothetical protein